MAGFKEVVRRTRLHRKDIVVEVEILLIKPLDAMQMHLDRVAVECREILGRDNILVEDNMHLIAIYPLGHLTLVRHDKMHLADKRHIHRYTAEDTKIWHKLTQEYSKDAVWIQKWFNQIQAQSAEALAMSLW